MITVQNSNGDRIAGAQIVVYEDTAPQVEGYTDANGEFYTELSGNNYYVIVSHTDYLTSYISSWDATYDLLVTMEAYTPPSPSANGVITAIRVHDISRNIWYSWNNGSWDSNGQPIVVAGSSNLAISFYAVNTGTAAGNLNLQLEVPTGTTVKNQSTWTNINSGALLGEWIGVMGAYSFQVTCRVSPPNNAVTFTVTPSSVSPTAHTVTFAQSAGGYISAVSDIDGTIFVAGTYGIADGTGILISAFPYNGYKFDHFAYGTTTDIRNPLGWWVASSFTITAVFSPTVPPVSNSKVKHVRVIDKLRNTYSNTTTTYPEGTKGVFNWNKDTGWDGKNNGVAEGEVGAPTVVIGTNSLLIEAVAVQFGDPGMMIVRLFVDDVEKANNNAFSDAIIGHDSTVTISWQQDMPASTVTVKITSVDV
jgi:hypothetical protein